MKTRVRPGKFTHVVYRTRRFERMIEWYKTVFDAKVQHQNPVLAFLTYDDEHHRFAFANLSLLMPGDVETDPKELEPLVIGQRRELPGGARNHEGFDV